MANLNHYISNKRRSSFPGMIERAKSRKNNQRKKPLSNKILLQKIFHPDYILFDWEYFSRELEFE